MVTVQPVGKAFFPLDQRWGLTDSLYSPRLAQQMVWLSGMALSYAAAAAVYQRISGRTISGVSLWRQTQRHGERLKTCWEDQQAHVSPERVVLPPAEHDHAQRQGVSMDGGMMSLRGEGWKEFKVGTVYDIVSHLERDPTTRELVERPHATRIQYTAVLGSVRQFSPALWTLAVQQGIPFAQTSSVTSDGADWIWNLVADYFPDSRQIVDLFHACQHLAEASAARFPHHPEQAQRWYDRHFQILFQGGAAVIAAELVAAGLPEQAHYFQTHQRRMQYQEFYEEGFPIGSGTVESGVKQFKARLTGSGMHWNRSSAEAMLVIRGAVLADTFDDLWAAAA